MIGRIRTFASNRISVFFQPDNFLYHAGPLGFFPSLITISTTWLRSRFNSFSRVTSLPSDHLRILRVGWACCAAFIETLFLTTTIRWVIFRDTRGKYKVPRGKASVMLGFWSRKGTSRGGGGHGASMRCTWYSCHVVMQNKQMIYIHRNPSAS